MLHGVGTFNNNVINNGAWITDPTTNIFTTNFIHTASAYMSATAGDVFIFTNDINSAGNFINRSTNNVAWNTKDAKFLFSSTLSVTQDFYAAGHNREAILPSSSATEELTGDWYAARSTNFALGTLELSNFSTVQVWDAFSGLGGEFGTNDFLKAALYVSNLVMSVNSFLIISDNVELYFLTSNSWGAANFALLGSGELHQVFNNGVELVVPEPSVALLWGAGAATVYFSRRRQRRKVVGRVPPRGGAAHVTPAEVSGPTTGVVTTSTSGTTGVVTAVPAAPVRTASKSKATPPARSSRRHRRHRRFYC
jgi:hypothetical protein